MVKLIRDSWLIFGSALRVMLRNAAWVCFGQFVEPAGSGGAAAGHRAAAGLPTRRGRAVVAGSAVADRRLDDGFVLLCRGPDTQERGGAGSSGQPGSAAAVAAVGDHAAAVI